MQIVIDIPEKTYNRIINFYQGSKARPTDYEIAIINGTPLPKGHGRLIDADAFIKTMENASKRQRYKKLLIDELLTVDDVFKAVIESLQNRGLAEGDAPTIIEADKENKKC